MKVFLFVAISAALFAASALPAIGIGKEVRMSEQKAPPTYDFDVFYGFKWGRRGWYSVKIGDNSALAKSKREQFTFYKRINDCLDGRWAIYFACRDYRLTAEYKVARQKERRRKNARR